jgi:hypothetical protein
VGEVFEIGGDGGFGARLVDGAGVVAVQVAGADGVGLGTVSCGENAPGGNRIQRRRKRRRTEVRRR